MKKILFYTQNRWAFGSIHHGLIKRLYAHGLYCNLLDWTLPTTYIEFHLLNEIYDLFMTTPEAVANLVGLGIPLSKIVCVAHCERDITLAAKNLGTEFYSQLAGMGVVCEPLVAVCAAAGISRTPVVVKVGIDFDLFYAPPAAELRNVGYAGEMTFRASSGEEIKRPELCQQAATAAKITLKVHEFYNCLCMPAYYRTVDALLMSSSYETAGLPIMEAAAAGRLCIGTPAGYFGENALKGGGILCPMEPALFVKSAAEALSFYAADAVAYRAKCVDIQEFARQHYDWAHVLEPWVELLS